MFLPQHAVLLEKHSFSKEFVLDFDVLRKTICWAASLKYDHAKRRFHEGKVYKAIKLVWLSLRYLIFGEQLVRTLKIDFSGANEYWPQLKHMKAEEWENIKDKVDSIYKELENKFKRSRNFRDFYTADDAHSYCRPTLFRSLAPKLSDKKMEDLSHKMQVVNAIRREGLLSFVKRNRIFYSRSEEDKSLVLLFLTSFSVQDELTSQCEGLIIDERTYQVVCAGFKRRVFNIQPFKGKESEMIDTKSLRVTEKVDGTYVLLFYHKDKWRISSKRLASGGEYVCYKDLFGSCPPKVTLRERFWSVWEKLGYKLPAETKKSFLFQLVLSEMRKLVNYESDDLYLVCVRNLETMQEEDFFSFSHKMGWKSPKLFDHLKTVEEIQGECTKMCDPFQRQGFVACDDSFNRVSFVSPFAFSAKISMGTMSKGFGPINIRAENFDFGLLLTIVKNGIDEVFLSYFPRWKEHISRIRADFDKFCQSFEEEWKQICDIQTDKEFIARNKTRYPNIMIDMRKKGEFLPFENFKNLLSFESYQTFTKMWKAIHSKKKK